MLTKFIVVTSQYICVSNHYVVHLKVIQYYMSFIAEEGKLKKWFLQEDDYLLKILESLYGLDWRYSCAWGTLLKIKKNFFNVYLFLRQRETEHEWERVRERGRHRIWSRLQALSCQHRARHGARAYEPQGHDLSWSQMLNPLSHPGAPGIFISFELESFWGQAQGPCLS